MDKIQKFLFNVIILSIILTTVFPILANSALVLAVMQIVALTLYGASSLIILLFVRSEDHAIN